MAALALPERLYVAGFTDRDSESARAVGALHDGLGYDPQPGLVVLARSARGRARLDSGAGRAALERLAGRLARDRAVGRVRTAFGVDSSPALLARDRRSALVLVHLRALTEDAVRAPLARLRADLREPGLELSFGGYWAGFIDTNVAARRDLVRAELIAFPLLALLLLVIFRGALAAAIPLMVGGVAVAATFAFVRLLAHVVDLSVFALNLAVFLGLGLAVDYALLMVSRFREEGARVEAVDVVVATAGRTVVFSGLAVSAACATLLLFPQPVIYSMGVAGVTVPLLCAAAARLLVPPFLRRFGGRMGAGAGRPAAASRWERLGSLVTSRPAVAFQLSLALLIALGAQTLDLRATFAGKEAIPPSFESRQVNDTIDREFTPQLIYPVQLAVGLEEERQAAVLQLVRLRSTLLGAPGVARVDAPRQVSERLGVLTLTPRAPPYSPSAQSLIRSLRALDAPLLVGGASAEFVDLRDSVSERAPVAALLAALLVALVLWAMTRSLVLALKTVLVAALSLVALVGAMVLLFQRLGVGTGPDAIETASVVVVVAMSLGLAVDYAIVLLARVVEEHRRGAADSAAVLVAIRRTGPVITSAALLLAVALLALATSGIFPVRQLTIGITIGIVLDATLVRMVLVPASMQLLGRWNWWPTGTGRRPV